MDVINNKLTKVEATLKRINRFCQFYTYAIFYFHYVKNGILIKLIIIKVHRGLKYKTLVENQQQSGFGGFQIAWLTSHFVPTYAYN